MAKCPACEHDVAAPFFLNLDAWRWLACPHCAARLERKNPRSVALIPLWIGLIALGRLGHRFAVIAEVLMVAMFVVVLVEFMRPQLQLRKPFAKARNQVRHQRPVELARKFKTSTFHRKSG
jgi:hypothetical protein